LHVGKALSVEIDNQYHITKYDYLSITSQTKYLH